MRKITPIVLKLIVYFLFLNIVTVLIVSTYSYQKAKSALVDRTFDQLISLRIEKKVRIENFFSDRLNEVELVSNTEETKNLLTLLDSRSRSGQTNDAIKEVFTRLMSTLSFRNYYQSVFLVDGSGRAFGLKPTEDSVRVSVFPEGNLKVINRLIDESMLGKSFIIDDYSLDHSKEIPTLLIGAPILLEDSTVIAFELDIKSISTIMYENNPHNGLGKSGESYLVGSDWLMRSTSRFQDNAVFKTMVQTEGARKALDGETGTSIINDYRGVPVLSSFSPVRIPGLNWAILAEIDKEEAMIPIVSIGNNILYLTIIIVLFSFAFIYLIGQRISVPILKLKDAAEKITGGNYDVFVEDIAQEDELQSLIQAFNEMSSKIKSQTENLNREKSMRLSSMMDGQEMERQRLSRELHDGLGQSILGLKMRLERVDLNSTEKSREIIEEMRGIFTQIIQEVRSVSNNLRPGILTEFGLQAALENLCKRVQNDTGILVAFNCQIMAEQLDDKTNTYIYRIVQEALNNVIKHAEASESKISLKQNTDGLNLEIWDNGKGFDTKIQPDISCNGISNMQERVNILHGECTIISNQENGTTIRIQLPVNSN